LISRVLTTAEEVGLETTQVPMGVVQAQVIEAVATSATTEMGAVEMEAA
jgi:hypothetical protein